METEKPMDQEAPWPTPAFGRRSQSLAGRVNNDLSAVNPRDFLLPSTSTVNLPKATTTAEDRIDAYIHARQVGAIVGIVAFSLIMVLTSISVIVKRRRLSKNKADGGGGSPQGDTGFKYWWMFGILGYFFLRKKGGSAKTEESASSFKGPVSSVTPVGGSSDQAAEHLLGRDGSGAAGGNPTSSQDPPVGWGLQAGEEYHPLRDQSRQAESSSFAPPQGAPVPYDSSVYDGSQYDPPVVRAPPPQYDPEVTPGPLRVAH